MLCEIARNLDAERLRRIETLERDLGLTIVAFSCRSVPPEREERLRRVMAELGPQLSVPPADADEDQLAAIREAEAAFGVSLVAVSPE